MIVLNIVLMALLSGAIVGLLFWSVCTQHRDEGGADLRIRHRLQVSVRLVRSDQPEFAGGSSIVPEI